jgi:uncharacterized protein (TIGR03083 family)
MNPDSELQAAVTNEFLALAELLDTLPAVGWDTPSLCAGWRVREVVAHVTMPARYSEEQFMAELQNCDGDFTRLSNTVATRDGALPTSVLVGNLRDDMLHHWAPPGGGYMGALNHVVIHGLDITVPLGSGRRSTDEDLRAVLDDLTSGGTHAHFGFAFDGLGLRATDMDWSFGSGTPISGAGEDLALLVCGRQLPAGRIEGTLT